MSKREIGRSFKLILRALNTSVDLITTGDFMSRFCSNLGLANKVRGPESLGRLQVGTSRTLRIFLIGLLLGLASNDHLGKKSLGILVNQ